MDIDIIRYFGAAYVMESTLAPKDKCDMIDYIKEAEWDQVLNLVFNGDRPNRKLTINEQYILEAQAENHIYPLILRYISEAGAKKKTITTKTKGKVKSTTPKEDALKIYTKTKRYGQTGYKKSKTGLQKMAPSLKRFGKGASAVVLIAAASAAGHRAYKIYLSKAARQCKGLARSDRRNCIVKFRKAGYQAKINSYAKARNDCAKSKDPARCTTQLNTKIKKVKYKMGTLYSRL